MRKVNWEKGSSLSYDALKKFGVLERSMRELCSGGSNLFTVTFLLHPHIDNFLTLQTLFFIIECKTKKRKSVTGIGAQELHVHRRSVGRIRQSFSDTPLTVLVINFFPHRT